MFCVWAVFGSQPLMYYQTLGFFFKAYQKKEETSLVVCEQELYDATLACWRGITGSCRWCSEGHQ